MPGPDLAFREDRSRLVQRVRVGRWVAAAVLSLLTVRYWAIQVLSGAHFEELAENNRLRREPVRPLRGVIYDRNGLVLVENVPSYRLTVVAERVREHDETVSEASALTGRSRERLELAWERARQRGRDSIVLAEGLTLDEVARVELGRLWHSELEIDVDHLRLYRHGPRVAHVVGYLGEVTEEDILRSDGALAPGELVGRDGVELAFDRALRGRAGERVEVVDSHGRTVEEVRYEPARPGRDIHLTLDLDLQQEAAVQLEGRTGAVVALDPRNGEILALVSSPSFDPNAFSRYLDPAAWRRLVEDPHHPLQARPFESTYSPGSVFKVVMAAAGLLEELVTPETEVRCTGSEVFYGRSFRCWKRGGHGQVDLRKALRESCDVYFYHLGKRLGIERIAAYARDFGLGSSTGLEVSGERAGLVPDPAWKLAARGEPWYPGETISVSIGQGPLLVTPLQMAVMMAVIANGGERVVPHLVRRTEGKERGRLRGAAAVLVPIREALRAVVDGGTGAAAEVPGLEIAGKTGTVQVVTQSTWTKNEDLPPELRDHAWFASFAPVSSPRLVVVVFVEHGGAGSKAAAPVARAIYERWAESVDGAI